MTAPLSLMSSRRHAELIKAAEDTVEGINAGLHPNAALKTAAEQHDLNSNEIALVSHAVNNSATVSHLVNSKGADKAAPFTLTNADEVTQELFPKNLETEAHNNPEPGERPKAESPLNLDPQAQKKKLAAAQDSYSDRGSYITAEPVMHAKVAREAFGAPVVYEDRLVGDPHAEVRNVKIAQEHARTEAMAARDRAFTGLVKLSEEFSRTDALPWERIETLAGHSGVGSDTLDLIASSAVPGQARPQFKIAAHIRMTCTPREHALVQRCHDIEESWKLAADWTAAEALMAAKVQEQFEHAVTTLKTAAEAEAKKSGGGGKVVNQGVKLVTDLTNVPAWSVGEDTLKPDSGEFLGKVTGDWKEDEQVKHPLDIAARQRLSNVSGAANFNTLFDDEYIAQQPIPTVVKAYNSVISANPGVDAATTAALVREQLARGGTTDSDSLLRLRKDRTDTVKSQGVKK